MSSILNRFFAKPDSEMLDFAQSAQFQSLYGFFTFCPDFLTRRNIPFLLACQSFCAGVVNAFIMACILVREGYVCAGLFQLLVLLLIAIPYALFLVIFDPLFCLLVIPYRYYCTDEDNFDNIPAWVKMLDVPTYVISEILFALVTALNFFCAGLCIPQMVLVMMRLSPQNIENQSLY